MLEKPLKTNFCRHSLKKKLSKMVVVTLNSTGVSTVNFYIAINCKIITRNNCHLDYNLIIRTRTKPQNYFNSVFIIPPPWV